MSWSYGVRAASHAVSPPVRQRQSTWILPQSPSPKRSQHSAMISTTLRRTRGWQDTPVTDELVSAVRSKGWQNDPKRQSWKLSDLDYQMPPVFLQTFLVYSTKRPFVRDDETRNLREGLAATLAQYRTLNAVFEKVNGEVMMVRAQGATVPFVVHQSKSSSLDSLEASGFAPADLARLAALEDNGHDHLALPAARVATAPQPLAAFQLTWIDGGFILRYGYHHYGIDAGGISAFMKQWANNTSQLARRSELQPVPWTLDDSDRERLTGVRASPETRVDSLPRRIAPQAGLQQHIGSPKQPVMLHFHPERVRNLKETTYPKGGEGSTYGAITALIWKCLTRARLTIFDPIQGETTVLTQAVDLRSRFNPPLNPCYQGNAVIGALTQPISVFDVASNSTLSQLASIIKDAHVGVTENAVRLINAVATLNDKTSAGWSGEGVARFNMAMTDQRFSSGYGVDFGFGPPCAVRSLDLPGLPAIMRRISKGDAELDTWGLVLEVQIDIDVACLKPFTQDPELLGFAEVVCS